MEKKQGFKFPHAWIVLFTIALIAAGLTYILPAGEYERKFDEVVKRTLVVPNSYQVVERTPIKPFDFFVAVQRGMIDAADIIFFIFIVFSAFYIVMKTGALVGFLGMLVRKLEGKEVMMIPVFMTIFAIGGATFGMFEETYGLIPMFIGLAMAVGYDAIVGMAMISLGVGIGFAAAPMNPFTVGVAHKIAELEMFSGLEYRTIWLVIFLLVSIWWTVRYAQKVKKDPSSSYVADVDFGILKVDKKDLFNTPFTLKRKLIMLLVGVTIVLIVYGVLAYGWYINELAGLFLIMGILAGIIGGFGANKLAETFVEGCQQVAFGALVVGIARTILIVMRDGKIIDTVINALATPLEGLPAYVSAVGMVIVQTLIDFFIPSGSGQAMAVMPIMAPLSDLIGVSRQVAVMAYQFGDGFTNLLWPTAGIVVMCGIAKIPLDKWWKFYVPLFLLLMLLQFVAVIVGVAIGWQ
ncbi:MAG: hypothetical protein DDT40_00213 [candidate division WS2 bacterium]|nr:hypothetical protein [Candidatus Psychracetigena formicireducens]